jgi:hypothetical protein
MLLHMGVFGQTAPGPQGMKEPIKEAFANFTAWRRQRKIQCSHRPFSYKSIFKDEYGCYLNAKGFNARLICQWLLDVVLWVKTQPDVILNTDDRLDVTEQCLKLGFQMVYVWFLFQVGIGVLTYVSYKIPRLYYCTSPARSRRGICRYFSLSERASRWLKLAAALHRA